MDPTGQDGLKARIVELEEALQVSEVRLKQERMKTENLKHTHHSQSNLQQYGHSDNIVFVEPDKSTNLIFKLARDKSATGAVCKGLIKTNLDQFLHRPVLHTWMRDGKIYRTATELVSSRFELFFDLLFVGIIHQIAETTAEQPNGIGLAKYILTYAPAYSVWSDVRDLGNQFTNDDVLQRMTSLWMMLLLIGYSNNASAIEVGEPGFEISEDSAKAIRWALGFFVVARFSRFVFTNVYGLFLPYSRLPLFIGSLISLVACILGLIGIFLPLEGVIIVIALSLAVDFALRVTGVLAYKTMLLLRRKKDNAQASPDSEKAQDETENDRGEELVNQTRPSAFWSTRDMRIPALNIEHHVERLGAFVTIVLGEMVVNVFFRAIGASEGLSPEIGRSFLGLMIAFNLNWIYFDSSPKRLHFVHALRRHWLTAYLFTFLHLPLTMGLLLASSAINRLITEEGIEEEAFSGIRWFFGAGLGVATLSMATLSALHKFLDDGIPNKAGSESLDTPVVSETTKARRSRNRRIVYLTRFACGIIMVLIPLAGEHLRPVEYLGIYVGLTAFMIIEETLARVERAEWELEQEDQKREHKE